MIRRLVRIGVLDDTRMRLDYVLALKTEDFLERRLQTQVFKLGWVVPATTGMLGVCADD